MIALAAAISAYMHLPQRDRKTMRASQELGNARKRQISSASSPRCDPAAARRGRRCAWAATARRPLRRRCCDGPPPWGRRVRGPFRAACCCRAPARLRTKRISSRLSDQCSWCTIVSRPFAQCMLDELSNHDRQSRLPSWCGAPRPTFRGKDSVPCLSDVAAGASFGFT